VVEPIPPEWHWRQAYKFGNINAFAFATGLAGLKSYREKIAKADNSLRGFASSLFTKDYIQSKDIKELDYPYEGCLVLYLDQNENVKHAAIVKENMSITVESKWGTFPVVFKHKLRDIPTSYGAIIKFYPPIDNRDAYDFFEKWLEL
jgi:hypothetical protein